MLKRFTGRYGSINIFLVSTYLSSFYPHVTSTSMNNRELRACKLSFWASIALVWAVNFLLPLRLPFTAVCSAYTAY